jgi:hypothetical protein
MRFIPLIALPVLLLWQVNLNAQSDTVALRMPSASAGFAAHDSLKLARLNTTGNLMIAGGIGLCGAGAFLIYEGQKIYTTPADSTGSSIATNHRQGTIYMVFGGASIIAGLLVTAFGAVKKVEFKRQKKSMMLRSGLLEDGNLGAQLWF